MKILVINSGSSSLKATLFDYKKEFKVLKKFHIEEIGRKNKIKTHEEGVKSLLKFLPAIDYIGHRVVHGGEKYSKATKLNSKVIKDLETLSPLAPLHNPINLESIKACLKYFPKAKQ